VRQHSHLQAVHCAHSPRPPPARAGGWQSRPPPAHPRGTEGTPRAARPCSHPQTNTRISGTFASESLPDHAHAHPRSLQGLPYASCCIQVAHIQCCLATASEHMAPPKHQHTHPRCVPVRVRIQAAGSGGSRASRAHPAHLMGASPSNVASGAVSSAGEPSGRSHRVTVAPCRYTSSPMALSAQTGRAGEQGACVSCHDDEERVLGASCDS
jgi:hypothetical protein